MAVSTGERTTSREATVSLSRGGAVAQVIFYRARTSIARANTFRLSVDGREVGTVRGSQRLEIELDRGEHVVSVRAGRAGSQDLVLTTADGSSSYVVIDVAAKDPGLAGDPMRALVLRESDQPSSLGSRRSALRFADESPALRLAVWIAAAVVVLGFLLRLVSPVIGVIIGGVAALFLLGFFGRKLLYRRSESSSS